MEHRYYIGFHLPETLSKDIQAVQQKLFNPEIMQSPLEPHITILPPPAVERIEPEELVRQVRITSRPFWPLRLSLTGVEGFKDHAVAVSVEGSPIYDLQQQLVELLPPEAKVTYYPNPQFKPHVTLAHALRGEHFSPTLIHEYEKQLKAILPAHFDATGLTIFRWTAPRHYTSEAI